MTNIEYIEFINNAITSAYGATRTGLKLLEIGNQDLVEYYSDLGMDARLLEPTMDNGNTWLHIVTANSILLNMATPEVFADYANTFDVITNVGAIEHIPLNQQYETWTVMNAITKVGGVMVHIMPDRERRDMRLDWIGHCNNYYDGEFFENLADKMGYEIVGNEVIHSNRSVALKKVVDKAFDLDRETFLSTIHLR
jgi:hypothetical protein